MKITWYLILSIAMMMITDSAIAQRHFPQGGRNRPGPERLERFKKMRLIEVLKLNEEDAVRFFAKQSAHEDNIHDLMKSRNDALDDMKSIVRDKEKTADLQKRVDQVLDTDQKIFAERQRFQAELRKFLTPEQFAKFLVFEQSFGRQMRDALEEMHKGKQRREDD